MRPIVVITALLLLFAVIAVLVAVGTSKLERAECERSVREFLSELRDDAEHGFPNLSVRDWRRYTDNLIDRQFVVLVTAPLLMNALGRLADALALLSGESDELLAPTDSRDLLSLIGDCEHHASHLVSLPRAIARSHQSRQSRGH
jgi:hypothetical protein